MFYVSRFMQFTYSAKSIDGQIKSGKQEAKDKEELAAALRSQGFFLMSVEDGSEKKRFDISALLAKLNFFQKISLVERIMFTRNLAVMIGAGLALNRALTVLKMQTTSKKFQAIIGQISDDIQAGKPFSESLNRHPNVFPDLYVSMVKIGETAGNLEEVLNNLAEQMKKDHDIVSRVKGALTYPAVILAVMLIVGYLMMTIVVPKLSAVFLELGADLPLSTKILITMSDIMKNYWYLAAGGAVVGVYLFRMFLKTSFGKRRLDELILKMPVIKNLSKQLNSARFCRTLSTLVDSGVPIVKALEILAHTMTNTLFSDSLKNAAEEIQKGKTLFNAMEKYSGLYPPLVTQMVAVGEETGSLTKVLIKLADFYEEEVNNITKNLSTIIEPVLMVIIGAAVGFFAISMITPMYNVMNNI